jgi:hypothetical protein
MGKLLGELVAAVVGVLAVYLWITAIAHDYKRNEPLLAAAWVFCPPCGVARGGYVFFVN